MHVTSKSGRVFDLPSPEEEARIRAGIAADPDTYELTDEEMSELRPLVRPGRPKAESTKTLISIRLSPDVLDFFKADGSGWQTRIDAALRDWIKTHAIDHGHRTN
ncbi:BrnA antitoxin family protein [uncultured Thiodictyon sp.]|uniref:BrnA antitoxin family protein n=1 Tax=uncultured Thiodictyon sp. TaxID=1846217 RepID=UPI0025E035D9|nr:BrnA antitoxin family protein [uncultured Thiodictyon sp.]